MTQCMLVVDVVDELVDVGRLIVVVVDVVAEVEDVVVVVLTQTPFWQVWLLEHFELSSTQAVLLALQTLQRLTAPGVQIWEETGFRVTLTFSPNHAIPSETIWKLTFWGLPIPSENLNAPKS